MKHFKVVGPKTTREFDIEDDQLIDWRIIKISAYENKVQNPKIYPLRNEVSYDT